MPARSIQARKTQRRRSLGQSIVEFTLLFPVLLLILMMGLDFGRVFLGWINLNNTARIAANYAATNATKIAANDPAARHALYQLVKNDADAINCSLPKEADFPAGSTYFPATTSLGDPVHVGISCKFGIITPIISTILGSPITVSASADFPIRTGIIAGVPGGGSGVVAIFNYSPLGGTAPRTIAFTDFSTGSPTSWKWDFDGDGTIDSTSPTGNSFTYSIPKVYHPSLEVSNGTSTDKVVHDITIIAPPGPVVAFTATPSSGQAPLLVTFTNSSTGSAPLTYLWNYGDGSPTSTAAVAPDHTYAVGTWIVTLKVTDNFAQSNSGSTTITVNPKQCTVPDFKGLQTSDNIQSLWLAAGFKTTVIFNPSRPPDYSIKSQTLAKNKPQPCDAAVQTVFK
jgi:PKD repeat protein